MALVTIRGFLGSGAPEVGKLVADRLGASYVDREIIAEVAARLHQKEQDVLAKEMPRGGLLGRITEALERSYAFGVGFEGAYLPAWEIPLNDNRYLQALDSVVKELARSPSIVIYGRGSHCILRDYPQAFHVQAVAPFEARLKRVMQELKLEPEAAKQEIARFDNGIRRFIKRYFQADLDDSVYYHLVINTDRLSFEAAADIIIHSLSVRQKTFGVPGESQG